MTPHDAALQPLIDRVNTARAAGAQLDIQGGGTKRFYGETPRGVAFDVRDAAGDQVCPAEPPPWSPPPPPPGAETTVVVTPSAPYRFKLDEPGKWVFPGPGRYTVRAVLTLWGPGAGRTTNYTVASDPVVVTVRP